MDNIKYQVGCWFAVPLRYGGFATGIVCRGQYKSKVGLGYFFGPKKTLLSEIRSVDNNVAKRAILIAWFGDLGIIKGRWPIISEEIMFNKNDWPVPFFRRIDVVNPSIGWLIQYDQENPVFSKPVRETKKDVRILTEYPDDTLFGSGAIERKLTKLLE